MTKAAKSLQSKTVNLALATDVDRAERNRLRELIAQHGAAKVAGIAAAGTAGLIGAAILGKRLLSPEEEAAVLQEKEANGVLPAAAVGLTGSGLMALGLASLMDGDDEEYLNARSPMEAMLKRDLDELEYQQAMRDGDVYSSDVAAENSIRSRRPRRF